MRDDAINRIRNSIQEIDDMLEDLRNFKAEPSKPALRVIKEDIPVQVYDIEKAQKENEEKKRKLAEQRKIQNGKVALEYKLHKK